MPPMLTSTMLIIGPARTRLAQRSLQSTRGPGGPYSGLKRIQIATVIMKIAVSSSPGRMPASSSRPIDCSVSSP